MFTNAKACLCMQAHHPLKPSESLGKSKAKHTTTPPLWNASSASKGLCHSNGWHMAMAGNSCPHYHGQSTKAESRTCLPQPVFDFGNLLKARPLKPVLLTEQPTPFFQALVQFGAVCNLSPECCLLKGSKVHIIQKVLAQTWDTFHALGQ